jgi:hypothetical protein
MLIYLLTLALPAIIGIAVALARLSKPRTK